MSVSYTHLDVYKRQVFINTGRPLVYFEKEILDIGVDGYLCSNGVHLIVDGKTVDVYKRQTTVFKNTVLG